MPVVAHSGMIRRAGDAMPARLEQGQINSNFDEADQFLSYWKKRPGFRREPSFPAVVTYRWAAKSVTDSTAVRITITGYGIEYQIDIEETSKLNLKKFHLRLSAYFQRYSYNEARHALIIKGDSPKMKGRFRIEIIPIINDHDLS